MTPRNSLPSWQPDWALCSRAQEQEHADARFQLLEIDTVAKPDELLRILQDNAATLEDGRIRYRAGLRLVCQLEELASSAESFVPWREGGVYLISGGAGGLGLLLAEEIVEQAAAHVVLIGRSPESMELRADLARARRPSATIEYRSVDVADAAAVDEFVRDVIQRHGSVNGVIHAAGSSEMHCSSTRAKTICRRCSRPSCAAH